MSVRSVVRYAVIAAVFALAGCESSPDKPSREPPPPPPRPSAATAEASGSAAPPPMPTLSATASAAAGDATGMWEGRYEAKKTALVLPAKVKDKAIAADDGKIASGPGNVEITITAGGDVRGKVTGALGASSITGKVDGAMVRAAVNADDLHALNAMTGTFVGAIKGDTIVAELHVAGPDATILREAAVELKRKK